MGRMLWRVRTTLPDRPGTLAVLAQRCGAAGVNILGLQIFPGLEDVTDELVLRTPMGWGAEQVADLMSGAGGSDVAVLPCREAALSDQPTRYIRAAQMILERPTAFPDVVARLFDTDTEPGASGAATGEPLDVPDVMEMAVGDVIVQVRRHPPFTPTEHARAAALADLVADVLRRSRPSAAPASGPADPANPSDLAGAVTPDYVVDGDTVTALCQGVVVGRASIVPESSGEEVVHRVSLSVEPAWRRRGIGTRLLVDAARLARTHGAEALVLTTASENPAVLPLVIAAGMRGLIRMADGQLSVRMPVQKLRPLPL